MSEQPACRSMTLEPHGGYPFFTIPTADFETAGEREAEYPTDETVKTICKAGQGEWTCRYLTGTADGFSCAKHTPLRFTLDSRVGEGEMIARGDNCDGMDSR